MIIIKQTRTWLSRSSVQQKKKQLWKIHYNKKRAHIYTEKKSQRNAMFSVYIQTVTKAKTIYKCPIKVRVEYTD